MFRKVGCEGVEWIQPAQDSGQWCAPVNTIMKLPVRRLITAENMLTKTISSGRDHSINTWSCTYLSLKYCDWNRPGSVTQRTLLLFAEQCDRMRVILMSHCTIVITRGSAGYVTTEAVINTDRRKTSATTPRQCHSYGRPAGRSVTSLFVHSDAACQLQNDAWERWHAGDDYTKHVANGSQTRAHTSKLFKVIFCKQYAATRKRTNCPREAVSPEINVPIQVCLSAVYLTTFFSDWGYISSNWVMLSKQWANRNKAVSNIFIECTESSWVTWTWRRVSSETSVTAYKTTWCHNLEDNWQSFM